MATGADKTETETLAARLSRPGRLPLVLLLLAFALLLGSATRKSATVDETVHLFRGAAVLKTGATHFLLGHPLGNSVLAALPLLTEPDLRLPVDDPAWEAGEWPVAGDRFLWQLNDNPRRLLFLGRLPVIWQTLLLGALLYRWGREWAGAPAGMLAATLLLLDPNLLAHGRLITGDLGITLFFTLTLYALWHWTTQSTQPTNQPSNHPTNKPTIQPTTPLLLAGLGLGLASLTKYNAALLLPILAVWGGGLAWQRRRWGPLLAVLVVMGTGALVIWAAYGFALRPWPGGAFWQDLAWAADYVGGDHGVYLAGNVSPDGWWYYFPLVFLVKTPVVVLGLLVVAGAWQVASGRGQVAALRPGRSQQQGLFLLLPVGVYAGASMVAALNIGYRYLLPVLPFLALFIATTLADADALRTRVRLPLAGASLPVTGVVAGGLAAALAVTALGHYPHYIPYFNLAAGGPAGGWRLLSDSNVDWGQDLPALAAWQDETGRDLKLSYFGTAYPSAYGVAFTPLPTWAAAPEQANPARQAYNPHDPAPGTYAISVTNLHGAVLGADRDAYAFFRDRTPVARPGHSIFIYQVDARGAPVDVAYSGLRPAGLDPALHAEFGSNDVRVRWLDATTSFVWPAEGGWLAVPAGQTPAPPIAPFWPDAPAATDREQALYVLPTPPALGWTEAPVTLGETVTFLGWQPVAGTPAGTRSLLTAWRVERPTDRPLKLFVHALDPAGAIAGQWDGLDVTSQSWQPGDVFVQWHRFAVAAPAGEVRLAAGVYDGDTGLRLTTSTDQDTLFLEE